MGGADLEEAWWSTGCTAEEMPEGLVDMEECLRNMEVTDWEARRKLVTKVCVGLRNLDMLTAMEYGEENETDEYEVVEDSRQKDNDNDDEAVNLIEGEEIEDLLAMEGRTSKGEFYDEPFEVVLDSGAGDHVTSGGDAPGYSLMESKGS